MDNFELFFEDGSRIFAPDCGVLYVDKQKDSTLKPGVYAIYDYPDIFLYYGYYENMEWYELSNKRGEPHKLKFIGYTTDELIRESRTN